MWLLLVGCKGVDAAPAALDDLFHWFWQRYDEPDDEPLADGLVNLDRVIDAAHLTEEVDGTISRLDAGEAALVGVTDRDPADAVGLYLLYAFDCPYGTLREVLSSPDQDVLYDGVYDSYDRTFDDGASRQQWLDRDVTRTDYSTRYSATVLGSTYEVNARGAFRTVPELDEELSPYGEFVVQRTHMPHPAVYEEETEKSFTQDYQIEIYWRRSGRIAHAYGLWRQADYGSGFDSENEASQRLLLNELKKWDDSTAENCLAGGP